MKKIGRPKGANRVVSPAHKEHLAKQAERESEVVQKHMDNILTQLFNGVTPGRISKTLTGVTGVFVRSLTIDEIRKKMHK